MGALTGLSGLSGLSALVGSGTPAYDPGDDFDVAFLIAGPEYCFTNEAGTTPAGEGDAVLCWTATNGKKFTKSSGSGATLQKVNDVWVVRFSGAGYLRAATGGTQMKVNCTYGGVLYRDSHSVIISAFGDTIFSAGVRRAFNINFPNVMSFSGLLADCSPGVSAALTDWANTLEIVDFSDSEVEFRIDSSSLGTVATSNPLVSFTSDEITLAANGGGGENFVGDIAVYGFKSSKLSGDRLSFYEEYSQAIQSLLAA